MSGSASFTSEELPPLPPGYGDEDFMPFFDDDDEMESLGSDGEDDWDDFEEVQRTKTKFLPSGTVYFTNTKKKLGCSNPAFDFLRDIQML